MEKVRKLLKIPFQLIIIFALTQTIVFAEETDESKQSTQNVEVESSEQQVNQEAKNVQEQIDEIKDTTTQPQSTQPNPDLEEVRSIIKEEYVDPVSEEVLSKPTVKEIVAELDLYSNYFTAEEYESFIDSIERNYTGIGVIVEKAEKGLYLLSIFEESPAKDAGLKAGDIILEADGTSLVDLSLEEATAIIRGEAGTTIRLTVLRPSTKEEFSVDVKRKQIHMPTVEYEKLAGNIGYIRLYSFNNQTAVKMKEAIEALKGVNGWIVDIRGNGGGYLKAAQQVAGFFPGVEKALLVEGRNQPKQEYQVLKQDVQFEKPVKLLINESSASASEILAGAIKDYQSAEIYGQQTFGKGLAQQLFELDSGGVLKLTVARFYTPKGNPINDVGVAPDIKTKEGFALSEAHHDFLTNNEKMTTFESSEKLSRNPVLTVKVAGSYSVSDFEKDVTLIELGNGKVPVEVIPTAFDTMNIKPKEKLTANAQYVVVVETGEKSYSMKFTTSDKIKENSPTLLPFKDVKHDNYFADAVTILAGEGIVKGVGNERFAPYHYLTREDAAVMFSRALELDLDNIRDPGFKDVKKGAYYYRAVAATTEAGIFNGIKADEFGVGNILTREEMAAIISRAFKLEAKDENVPFSDVEDSYFKTDIIKIYHLGITKGYTPTRFAPYKAVTRGDFSTFLYRAMVTQLEGTPTVKSIEAYSTQTTSTNEKLDEAS